jgi:superfamily II DNA or RNA helicase
LVNIQLTNQLKTMLKVLLLLVFVFCALSTPCIPAGGGALTLSNENILTKRQKAANKNVGQRCPHQSLTCKLDCNCGPVYLNLESVGLRCPAGSSVLEEDTESCYGCSCNFFSQFASRKTSICVHNCMAVAATLENQADALEQEANELEFQFQ